MYFDKLIEQVRPQRPRKVAVAGAEDIVVLKAVAEAYHMHIAEPILCGNEQEIKKLAREHQIDISDFSIFDASLEQAAKTAVSLIKEGKADMLMKGLLQTSDLLRAVLDRENGLHSDKTSVLSHVSVAYSPILQRMMLLTDGAMVTYPDLKTKAKMIENAVKAARGLGIEKPRVAVLAPVEVVNSEMPATVDAALLAVMNRRGQIRNCIVDGPLAMDVALSEEAVRHKGIVSEVAGRADILLMHNIDVGNSVIKSFVIGGSCLLGGVIMGADAPVVLTSRSDSDQSKLYSIACAASICGN